jgi:hypothetical protein
VTRFAPAAQAAFTVSLDSASAGPVSVNYATANGTAAAGTDYGQTSGTLTFAPGATAQTVNVPIPTVATGGPTKTFTLNLSGASGATISRGQGTGSILNRQTKFFVVDSGTVKTYEYGSGGTSEEITVPQGSSNTAPRGVATTAAGTTVWVADANKTIYVYDAHGVQLGSWAAGGLPKNAAVEGIATNGTDVWVLANSTSKDKVFKYTGAAGRLSGSQSAGSSFGLASADTNPKDIVTDGSSLWVVDDGSSADKVFKYSLTGTLQGNWAIDPANAHPTGLTINPANVSDVWIVDSGTLKVYQYTGAASRTSGSQTAGATFALNPYDTDPQGIADPPAPGDRIDDGRADPIRVAAPESGRQPRLAVLPAVEPTGRPEIPIAQGAASLAQTAARPSAADGWTGLAWVRGPARRKASLFADWLAGAAAEGA